MQRVDNVFHILENSFKIYKNKHFPISSIIEKFPMFSIIQPFDKNEFQIINQNRNIFTETSQIFAEKHFLNQFDALKLQNIHTIIQNSHISHNELLFFADCVLNQYISFVILYEKIQALQGIDTLFKLLSEFSNLDFQNIINESIRDLILIISNNLTNELFEMMFVPISDYFLAQISKHSPSCIIDDRKTFSLLPFLLKRMYELEGFENSDNSEKISSFLSILFIDNAKYFSHEAFLEIYNVITPYLNVMNKSALIIMKDLINYIDKDTVWSYFRNLPKMFENIVEKESQPIIPNPIYIFDEKERSLNINDETKIENSESKIEDTNTLEANTKTNINNPFFTSHVMVKNIITINPSQSPECIYRFSNVPSFNNGLDLTKSSCEYLPKTFDLRQIFSPSYFYIIDLISKSLIQQVKNHDEESQIFVDSLTDFIDNEKSGNKFEFDYICILIFYWIKLDIRCIKLPKNLLNPTTSLKIEKLNFNDKLAYLTINYLTLMKILQNGESRFDSILTSYVKYPHFLAEIFEICFMQITNLSAMISQHTWIVRTFRQISLQLQTSEIEYFTSDFDDKKNDLFIDVIEEARLSIFRLFSELFQYNSFLKLFLSDILFLSFFLSLLFEKNIRQFVLQQLQKYLQCGISKENLSKFGFQVTQMINQIYPSLNDNKDGLNLIEDIVKMLNSVKNLILNNIDEIQPLCQALTTTFEFLDSSDDSRRIFYQIISLFTFVPGISLDLIESPLKKFGKLNNDEYQSLLNLLASKILVDTESEFEIKNGNLMNILFRVYLNHSEVDIVGLSTKLCTHSNKNCFILHKCNYDILILDYVLKHRNDNEGSQSLNHISAILNNVVLISSVVSSPVVVRKFISLFIPIDNRYTSTIHHLLLNPLKMILERAQEIPSSTFSLFQAVSVSIDSMKQQLDKDAFSFTCWIYFEGFHRSKGNERINILTLLNSDMKPFFNFSLDGNVLVIQDQKTNIQMPKKIWEFVSIIYNDNKVQFFIEDQEFWIENIFVKVPFGTVTVCIGGINTTSLKIENKEIIKNKNDDSNNFVAQICNINIFPLHFPQLPAIIYKLGPRGTQKKFKYLLSLDQTHMSKIAGYSTHAQNRNFADILLRFFKVEILLPFFAQVDLKTVNGKPSNFNIIDVVSVFKEALAAGEMEQIEFYKKHGFSIISHLLIFTSPNQISYDLYLSFYDIFEILLSEDIKKDMLKNILMNFDIWIVTEHQDHMKILVHWRKLIPRYDSFFTKFFPFSRLLELMRIYYWYTPIEKDKIRGEQQSSDDQIALEKDDYDSCLSHRSRNPNLKISDCRAMMFNILYEISQLQFLDEDFSTLMDHCINIKDKGQRIDLLCFMNTIANADFLPFQQIRNTLQTLSKITVLLHSDNKLIISTVLNIICSVHMHCEVKENESFSLDQNLEAIIKCIEPTSMNAGLLNELIILLNQGIYNLFPVCAYVSYNIGNIRLYQEINPSQDFVVSPNWEIWSVSQALNQNESHSSFTIFQFLICCSHKEWKNIYDTIEIVGQAMKMDELKVDQYKTSFLKVLCLCILNTDTFVPSDVFNSLFCLLKQHIFFRSKDENDSYSRALESLYLKSPFYTKEEEYLMQFNEIKTVDNNIINSHLRQEDFLKLDLKHHSYKFGFNINENLSWADKDVAQQVLMLVTKFREETKENIGFAIIIAAFLCHCCVDFVESQLSEIQLTDEEISTFSHQVVFLYSKLKGLSSSFANDHKIANDFLIKKQMSITEIMGNASFILNSLERDTMKNDDELSYIQLFNTFVNYSISSSEKLSIVEGKTKVKTILKSPSGLSSDTEFSSHFNEESSTDKENASLNLSKHEGSDDIVEVINDSSFDHEEENDTEIDSESFGANFKVDLVEKIRNRIEKNSKLWKTLWSNVVMDGAPWDSSLISGKPSIIRWKRDNTHCRYFCPFKMKRNQRPNSHIDASFARDAGCFSEASKLLEVHNQKLHEEYLKSAPPILLEIDHPTSLININNNNSVINSSFISRSNSLNPNKSQSSFQTRGPNSLKRRKRIKSTSIMLISPENSRSNISLLKKNKTKLKKTFSFDCEYLKIRGLKHGKLVFENDVIHFIEESKDESESKSLLINIRDITHVFMRNRFHIKSAIEIFVLSGKSYFFNFPNNKSTDIVTKISASLAQLDSLPLSHIHSDQRVLALSLSSLNQLQQLQQNQQQNQQSLLKSVVLQNEESPKFFKNQHFTEDWIQGKMSNFEYLMKLNIYSERTFNDASQYPFFPWVLRNYTSNEIDLNDSNNFRDLAKPIGAMNEERLHELVQRMNDMSFFAGSSFLYSSFAVCPLSVYLWFVRIEPFTSLHIMMQSKKFDHPSRLFSSIPTSYKLVTTHLNDYRELPPEFFFMPEFLFNENEFDLGATRGRKINDVILPNWVTSKEEENQEQTNEKQQEKAGASQDDDSNKQPQESSKTNDDSVSNEKQQEYEVNNEKQQEYEVNNEKQQEYEVNNEKQQEYEVNNEKQQEKAGQNQVDDSSKQSQESSKTNEDSVSNEKQQDKVSTNQDKPSSTEQSNVQGSPSSSQNKSTQKDSKTSKEGNENEAAKPGVKNSFKSGIECVYLFRKALESDEVSLHLNEWIDLFWGFKQRGEEAKKALNLYNPNMYETAWTPQSLKDPQKRAEIESTMCHVGQFPPQMFTEPHPIREYLDKNKSTNSSSSFQSSFQLPYDKIDCAFLYSEPGLLILCLYSNDEAKKQRIVAQVSLSIEFNEFEDKVNFTSSMIRESEVKKEVICIGFQQSLQQIVAAQRTGKLVHFAQNMKLQNKLERSFLIPELPNISKFATSGEFIAIVSDDATLNLYGFGRKIEFKIEFYGDQITCCALSKEFKIAACGTVSGRIVLCSLFEGKKVCVIPLIHDAREKVKDFEIVEMNPLKVLITEAWGFIATFAQAFDGTGNSKLLVFLHNINGRFIRCVDVGKFPVSCWSSFKSRKDFDYIVMANSKGMVYVFEAFYLDFGSPIIKCYNRVVAVGYSSDKKAIVAVKEDGNSIVSSICID